MGQNDARDLWDGRGRTARRRNSERGAVSRPVPTRMVATNPMPKNVFNFTIARTETRIWTRNDYRPFPFGIPKMVVFMLLALCVNAAGDERQ